MSFNLILSALILALGPTIAHSQNIIAIVGTVGFDGQYFNPDTNKTNLQPDNFGYPKTASWPATASCGGKLYISGGLDANHQTMTFIVVWDKASNRTEVHDGFVMTSPRHFHSMTCDPDGTHLIICGGGQRFTSNLFSYNDCESCSITGTDAFTCTRRSTFQAHRYGHTSVVYNGMLLLMGGLNADGVFMDTVFANTLGTNDWHQLPSMPVSRANFGAAIKAQGNTLLACGGKDNDDLYNTCFQFNGNSWNSATTIGNMNLARAYFSMVTYNNIIYALGGFQNDTIEIYNGQHWIRDQGKLLNIGFTYTAQIV